MTRIGVLVVDDSVVIRRLVTGVLAEDPDIEVLGTAPNGRVALDKLRQLTPDVVTLDIEMPVLDGLSTLKELRRDYPRLPVVMFSTLTERAGAATLEALALGASDYVTKPANVGSVPQAIASVREQLVPKIKALAGRRPVRRVTTAPPPRTSNAPLPRHPVQVLAIGASTGGPEALGRVLPLLPATLPVPVVVVQHMPPLFTQLFAERLDRACALTVREAGDGQPLRPGEVLVAPGGRHLTVVRRGTSVVTALTDTPPENFCRPAVDPLFRSVVTTYGGGVLALVLTGMGQDGRRGAEAVREAGGSVLVQDEATSVVWGMPGAVAQAGLADRVLPLDMVAPELLTLCNHGRTIPRARNLEVPA